LKALLKNKELPQSYRPVTEVNLRAQIGKGSAAMPAFGSGLSAAEISNLLAYLKTL
jgi:mono/diheme cytochrome c family protein